VKGILIKKSDIQGKGVFAEKYFKKDEKILAVKGPVIFYPTSPDKRIGQDWLNVGFNKWKIAPYSSPWNFLNHSCKPNAGLKGSSVVIATRPIKKGDEITLDYSFTESYQAWSMNCRCGLPECRKTIRSIQFLPDNTFNKHKEYTSNFLRKEYYKQKVYAYKDKNVSMIKAKRLIKKGELIFTVDGPTIKYTRTPDYRIGYKWLAVGKNVWLIPKRCNPWFSMQHSCNPNSGLLGKNKVIALRNIHAEEEITLDDSITETDPKWKRKCSCGSKKCRKIIRSVQFLPKNIFYKYYPYISSFSKQTYKQNNATK
jgi:hypothetical protein